MFVLLFCAVLSLATLTFLIKIYNRKKSFNIPPLAGGALPIVGHSFLVLANRKRFYQLLVDTLLGPLMKKGEGAATLRLGIWDMYVLMDPDDSYLLASTCLKKDPMVYNFFKPMFGDYGLVTADVPIWKKHRKLLNPMFNQSVLHTYMAVFNDRSRQLVRNLSQEVGKGSFDQMLYARKTVLQIVSGTIGFPVNDEHLLEKVGTAIEIFTSCVAERIMNFFYYNNYLYNLSSLKKKHDMACGYLHDIADVGLSKHKVKMIAAEDHTDECKGQSKPRFKSFPDLIMDLSKDNTLSDSEIKEELNTFIGGALDTTYHAIGITLLTLGSYPEVQKKVFKEQQEIFNGTERAVEKQDLSKFKYLEAVIKETLRLYPVVFLVGRILDVDLNFKNYSLPAGSRCYMSIYHICRHPVWGPDAEQFRPERWLDGSLPNNARAYAVFSLGRRNCIGSNYAMILMKTVLSHVVRRYSVSGDVTQLVQKFDIVITPLTGYQIRIENRKESTEIK